MASITDDQRFDFAVGGGAGAGSGCLGGGGASVCTAQLDAASVACACGIRPGSGASAFSRISPVAVGESMILETSEVLRAMVKHNRIPVPGLGVYPCAGVYAVVVASGTVNVAQRVVALPRGKTRHKVRRLVEQALKRAEARVPIGFGRLVGG